MKRIFELNDDIKDFIQQNPLAITSTINDDGQTIHMAASYVITDEEFNIFFITRSTSHKVLNLKSRPILTLFFTSESPPRSVEVVADVTIIDDINTITWAIDNISKVANEHIRHYIAPIAQTSDGTLLVIKCKSKLIEFKDFS